MICFGCEKEIAGKPVRAKPGRNACSPNSVRDRNNNCVVYDFCSTECRDRDNALRQEFFGELDQNCSDCEHFQHDRWENKRRYGKCLKKDMDVATWPLNPDKVCGMDNSECFELRKRYITGV